MKEKRKRGAASLVGCLIPMLSIIGAFGGILLLFYSSVASTKELLPYSQTLTSAVESCITHQTIGGDTISEIRYEYEVDGHYIGTAEGKGNLCAKFSAGKTVRIGYLPTDPSESRVLEDEFVRHDPVIGGVIGGVLLLVVSLLAGGVFSWHEIRAKRKAGAKGNVCMVGLLLLLLYGLFILIACPVTIIGFLLGIDENLLRIILPFTLLGSTYGLIHLVAQRKRRAQPSAIAEQKDESV